MAWHCASISRELSGYQIPHLDSISLQNCVFVQAHEGLDPADFKMLWISLTSDLSHFCHLKVRSTKLFPRLPPKSMEGAEDLQGTIYPTFLDT